MTKACELALPFITVRLHVIKLRELLSIFGELWYAMHVLTFLHLLEKLLQHLRPSKDPAYADFYCIID